MLVPWMWSVVIADLSCFLSDSPAVLAMEATFEAHFDDDAIRAPLEFIGSDDECGSSARSRSREPRPATSPSSPETSEFSNGQVYTCSVSLILSMNERINLTKSHYCEKKEAFIYNTAKSALSRLH
jgi:hypothetical protein